MDRSRKLIYSVFSIIKILVTFTYIMIISNYLNILYKLSPQRATKVTVNFFSKPVFPKKRKLHNSIFQKAIHLEHIQMGKKIASYQWGNGDNAILLIHGWGGRASNFEKLITALVREGNTVYAFDAPAHGNSKGKFTNVLEFRDVALNLIRKNNGIKYIVGHSLGGVAAALALKELEKEKSYYKLVLLSTPSDLESLFNTFIRFLKLPNQAFVDGVKYIKDNVGLDLMKSSLINMPPPTNVTSTIIIHDKADKYVSFSNSEDIISHWNISNENILITNSLGHYKILANTAVIEKIQRATL
jgi:predicted alpha/beta hydrolase family esterase